MRKKTAFPTASVPLLLLLAPASSPSGAQSAAWIGLSGRHAQTFFEETQGLHGPAELDQFGWALAAGDFNGDGADDLATGIPGNDCGFDPVLSNCGAVQVRLGFRELGGLPPGNGVFVLSAETAGAPGPTQAFDRFGYALATGDFNGDGFDDLAAGQPDAANATGSVDVHYGIPGGIELVAAENLRPGVADLPAAISGSLNFGAALAVGNFNCDLFDDIAMGFPSERFTVGSGVAIAGSVFVANGSNGGLLPFDGYRIAQNEPAIPDDVESGDRFGEAVAAGDWNGDGCDDLAIGVPEEDGVGAVLVLFGNPFGLLFANNYWLGLVDLGTGTTTDDRFGAKLAAGDWNGDGFDDLAIGVPGRDDIVLGRTDVGMAGILYGAPGSPMFGGGGFNFAARQWLWEQILPGHSGLDNDGFASSFASGDFTGDHIDDLVIGTPGNAGTGNDTGQITLLTGGPGLLSVDRVRAFWPGVDGIPGPEVEQTDYQFGKVLAAGDFDGNGQADLAIGMPNLNVTGTDDGGETVLYSYLFLDGFEAGTLLGLDSWSSSAR